jgi:hypothetical protein
VLSQANSYLECPICLELAKNAVECEACNNLMCEQCVKDLKKKECPACRKQNFTVKPSVLARRMIGSMPQVCPNECGTTSTIGNMSDHLKKCPNRVLQCAKCAFEGKKADFLAHLTKDHE